VSRLTPAQCRAARALLVLPRLELAKLAVTPAKLIADYEAGVWAPRAEDLAAIQDALERAGVEFIESGVKLKGTGN
jgi:hypothetical protein